MIRNKTNRRNSYKRNFNYLKNMPTKIHTANSNNNSTLLNDYILSKYKSLLPYSYLQKQFSLVKWMLDNPYFGTNEIKTEVKNLEKVVLNPKLYL